MSQSVPIEDSKSCPYCAEIIRAAAIKCPHCQRVLILYGRPSLDRKARPTVAVPEELRHFEPATLWLYGQLDTPKSNETLGELSGLDQEVLMDHLAKLILAGVVSTTVNIGSSGIDFYRTRKYSTAQMEAIRSTALRAALPRRDRGGTYAPRHPAAGPGDSGLTPAPTQRVPTGTPVPLKKWRGLSHMTRQSSVDSRCNSCHAVYVVEGAAANAVADQQGFGSRMMRWGTRTEQLGATFTIGASGRRIAAGNESERLNAGLAAAHSLVSCPRCSSTDVLLYKQ